VIVPLLLVAAAAANEALHINQTMVPAIQRLMNEPGEFERWVRPLPGYALIWPYRDQVLAIASDVVGSGGVFIFTALSITTLATAAFAFQFVVLLYTMYFFLTDGPVLLRAVLTYLPLAAEDKEHILTRFVSVTRATLKGTMLLGLLQGTLAGLAFWAVGIDGAIFWGTVMTLLSIIPDIGAALVWVPAVVILFVMGQTWQAVALGLFCAVVVSSIDNVLRPVLVGHDTQMHELLIFYSTLGGLLFFGAMGFILGPILAALFVTIWELFGAAFHSGLAEPKDPARIDLFE